MRKRENQCVHCGLPCIGNSCPYKNVEVIICDVCEESIGEYHIDGEDYCEECARKYIQSIFNDLTIIERAELFGVKITRI